METVDGDLGKGFVPGSVRIKDFPGARRSFDSTLLLVSLSQVALPGAPGIQGNSISRTVYRLKITFLIQSWGT